MRPTSLLETYKKERLEFGVALFLSYQPIVNALMMLSGSNRGFSVSSRLWVFVRMASLAIVAISLLSSFTHIVKRIRFDIPFVVWTFTLLFMIACLDPTKLKIIREQNMFVFTFLECLPLYVMCREVADWRALWKWIKNFNYVIFAVYILAFLLVNVGSTYRYRTFAGGVTLSSLVFMIEWAYVGNKFAVAPMAVSLFLVVTCGRRSSVVLLLIAYLLICYYRKRYKYILAGTLVALIILLFGRQILTVAYDIISSFGVRPRNLYRVVAGTAGDDSGRFDRWIAVLKEVNFSIRNQLFGMGLFSDRVVLMNHLLYDTDRALYPHGIVVELIAHYGYLMGLAIFFWTFVLTPLRGAFLQERRQDFACVLILSYSMSLALLFQGSYLQDKFFFMLLGMAVWLGKISQLSNADRGESATLRQEFNHLSMSPQSAKLSSWQASAPYQSNDHNEHGQFPSDREVHDE